MKIYDLGITILACILAVCIVSGVVSTYFLGPNNAVEKVDEEIVQDIAPEIVKDLENLPKK